MCGRYRLSRRKQMIQEYFDTARRSGLGASIQRRSVATRWHRSAGQDEARTSFLTCAVGG
jgi:hypothetical protein